MNSVGNSALPHTTVAVIIPVRNGAATIATTVAAVRAQSLTPADIVVVDNGSTDDTAAVARRAGARVVSEPTPGSYAARNAGIAATTAAILAFTDADCTPARTWLHHLVGGLDDEAIEVAGGTVVAPRLKTAAERWAQARHVLDQEHAFASASFLPFFATANVAWRREALMGIGGFEAGLRSGGDVDACWRLQRRGGRLSFVPEAVVVHPHRARVRDLVRQHHRYAVGHGRLDLRWAADPDYVRAAGTVRTRTRALWLTPARVPWRIVQGADVAIPLVDAVVRLVHEVGRRRGRRMPPLAPVSPRPVAEPAAV